MRTGTLAALTLTLTLTMRTGTLAAATIWAV